MKKIVILLFLLPMLSFSQSKVSGNVTEEINGKQEPILGANIYWSGTTIGTVTNEKGQFTIPFSKENKLLVISYVGYQQKVITVTEPKSVTVQLSPSSDLETIVINAERKATQVSLLDSRNIIILNSKELLKAACCNLSESFETNASIDVNFSDAVTGTKQIKMLGLTNPYILITQENIPSVRGASQAYGLTFTPGTWLESIQITKGSGSVVNGFESIAGQINTELKKPFTDDAFFVNTYASIDGRLEFNTHFNQKLNDKWSTGMYIHVNNRSLKRDENNDNFMDAPLTNQINLMNRWQYTNPESGWVSFVDFRYMKDNKQAGEIDFDPETDKLTTNAWGSEIKTKRIDVSNKTGFVFKDQKYKSFGLQTSYSNHDQNAYFGLRRYDINHQSVYSNFIYNSILSNTQNKFKTGLSFTYDQYEEHVLNSDIDRKENSLGAFFEYTYDNGENLSVVAGIRADTHNVLGEFITPRLHIRYNPWKNSVLRASVGKGKRSASVFAENQHYFASSRVFNIMSSGNGAYGLDPEEAWNYGTSFLQKFKLFGKKADWSVDYYATNFKNQVVVDVDSNPQEVSFYNLNGESVAHSFQTDFNYNLAKHLDLRLSYKYYNVVSDYQFNKLSKPLLADNRVLANVSYQTHYLNDKGSRWKFDATLNWLGKQRLPNTSTNPVQYQLGTYTNPYSKLNLQVTKVFTKQFEIYVGGENVLGYKQETPILAADDPFGAYFDSTIVHGPIQGATVYAGLRFKIK
ncbi:MAG: TonB-dependent receptor [Flavobacteriaceae bacterium]|nr:TonB-dependent receptor [Flavobacteriaceae bacterium]